MKLTKSMQQVLDSIDGTVRISKTTKRHYAAIAELKRLGIIEKGVDDILRRVKNFGMKIPVKNEVSKRWATAIWRRVMAGSTIAEIAYTAWGNSREESMRRADIIIELLQTGALK